MKIGGLNGLIIYDFKTISLMRKHAIEFGERLIQMEKIYRERKSGLSL